MKLTAKQLIYFEFIYSLFLMQWMTKFGISNVKVLIPDLINILVILKFREVFWETCCEWRVRRITGTVFLFLFITFFGSIFGDMTTGGIKSIILAIWDMRIIVRPFIFFALSVAFFEKEDLDRIFSLLYKLQFVNVALSLFQYYVQGYWMDVNGGIFSTVQGCNKYSNVFCCIMIAWVLARFVKGKCKVSEVILTLLCSVVIAIFAELKFLFIEMIIIVLLCILFSGGGKKTLNMVIIGTLIIWFGGYLLMTLFPSSFEILTDSELFMWYAKDMSYSNTAVSINRLSGIDIIDQHMFGNSLIRKLLGYGWGAIGQIPFLGLYSPIAVQYQSLNFIVFTYSWIYAEVGIVGLFLFYLILVTIMLSINRSYEEQTQQDEYAILSKVTLLLTIVLSIYDGSWITEGPTFLCFFAIASAFISSRGAENDYNLENV